MKPVLFIIIIGATLLLGLLINNTFLRAHYLGIGKKVEFIANLKGIECLPGECEITFSSEIKDDWIYSFKWQGEGFKLGSKMNVTMIQNEHKQLCLIDINDGFTRENFSHLSFCYPIVKQSEEEWNRLRIR